jgi:hypothetical protein
MAISFRALRRQVRSIWAPPPLSEFADYDDYWEARGDAVGLDSMRWRIAADLIPDGATVLDVGSGSCEFATYLTSQKPGGSVTTADVAERAVQLARQAGFTSFQLDLCTGTIEENYDYITCLEVLEHIPESERALAALGAASRHLIVSVPNVGYVFCRLRLLLGRFPLTNCVHHIKEHVRFWTLRDFRYWASVQGYQVVGVHGHAGVPFLYKRAPGWFASGIVYELVPIRSDADVPTGPRLRAPS